MTFVLFLLFAVIYGEEVCQTESFKASCSDDEVVVMTSAQYGRMRLGKCIEVITTNSIAMCGLIQHGIRSHC